MNPRIELDAVLRSTSIFSFPGGDFWGGVPFENLVSLVSFVLASLASFGPFISFTTLGASLGMGMPLGCVVFDDPSDGMIELGCNGPAGGRSPEGEEMT
jgi:hypothetical protein